MLIPLRSQHGNGIPIFAGSSYQRGSCFGSVLSSIFRNVILPTAKNVGKSLLRTWLKKTSGIMRGAAEGKTLSQAFSDEFTSPSTKSGTIPPRRNRVNARRRAGTPLRNTSKKRKIPKRNISCNDIFQ